MCMKKQFVTKNGYKWAKNILVEKIVHGVKMYTLSVKEEVPGTALSKKNVLLTVYRDMKGPIKTILFLNV